MPAAIGGRMILSGTWSGAGVFNMEQNDPDPFMDALNRYGLPWNCIELTREQAESLTVVK